jgi:hypothetical protein
MSASTAGNSLGRIRNYIPRFAYRRPDGVVVIPIGALAP